jgi:hypothetical protein
MSLNSPSSTPDARSWAAGVLVQLLKGSIAIQKAHRQIDWQRPEVRSWEEAEHVGIAVQTLMQHLTWHRAAELCVGRAPEGGEWGAGGGGRVGVDARPIGHLPNQIIPSEQQWKRESEARDYSHYVEPKMALTTFKTWGEGLRALQGKAPT